MKGLFAATLPFLVCGHAFAEPPVLPLPWVKLSEIYYTPSQARTYGSNGVINCGGAPCNAVYVQTHLPVGSDEGPQATICVDAPACTKWTSAPVTIDFRPFGVAEDGKVAFLTGILVITHGSTVETADIHVTFAAAGSPIDCTKYIGQTVEADVGGGQRSNMSTLAPLTDGQTQMCYYLNTPGRWPTNSSYAINLSIQAWGR